MRAVGIAPESFDPDDRIETKRVIKMRKQGVAARRLVAQSRAELLRIGRDEQKIVSVGEMFGGGFAHLASRREMNIAVGEIDGRAAEFAFRFGFAPERRGGDFEIRGMR